MYHISVDNLELYFLTVMHVFSLISSLEIWNKKKLEQNTKKVFPPVFFCCRLGVNCKMKYIHVTY